MKQQYTLMIFTENHIGLLNRVTIIFTRRHINIESLSVSASEVKGIHRFTIVIKATEEQVIKVVGQIEKQIEVLKCAYYTEEEIVYQEIALYKIPTPAFKNGNTVEHLFRKYNARVIRIEPDYVVIEKTGHSNETQELFDKLTPYGVLQFNRSGRIAISKEIKELTSYLNELSEKRAYSVIGEPK